MKISLFLLRIFAYATTITTLVADEKRDTPARLLYICESFAGFDESYVCNKTKDSLATLGIAVLGDSRLSLDEIGERLRQKRIKEWSDAIGAKQFRELNQAPIITIAELGNDECVIVDRSKSATTTTFSSVRTTKIAKLLQNRHSSVKIIRFAGLERNLLPEIQGVTFGGDGRKITQLAFPVYLITRIEQLFRLQPGDIIFLEN
jgi:hypothetical protein